MAITATKRLQEIVDLLDQKGYVKAKELSQKYQVSMETIRKDLTFLEEKGVVKVARNMKKLGIPLDSIVLSTGLTIEEIERL